MKPLITIIIPAFNVEKYVKKCIDSIKEQTFQDYEVIIVDDGSSDNTLKVINENINDKFTVISQKNSGAGYARNAGIKLSNGKYIGFMDSDDFLYDKNSLDKVAKILLEKNADVITYKMVRYYDKKNNFLEEDNITEENKLFKNVEEYLALTIKSSRLSVSPCDKFIKSSILKKNKIYFDNFAMLEDIDWSLIVFKYTKSVYVLNEPIYVYRKQRTGSTTSFYNFRKTESCYNIIKKWCNYCNAGEKHGDLYLNYIAYQYIILLAAINKKNCSKEIIKELKNYKYLLKYSENFKVRLAEKMYKIFGYNIMILILKTYIYLKDKNVILIRR